MLAGVCESDLPKPKFIVHIYSVTYIPKSIHAINTCSYANVKIIMPIYKTHFATRYLSAYDFS